MLAAHRDTHFRFLKEVKLGESIWLESPDGKWINYQVNGLVVRENDTHHLDQTKTGAL